MKKRLFVLSSLMLLGTLASCSGVTNKNVSDDFVIRGVNDGELEGYEKLNDYLYVSHLPGHYNNKINLEFKTVDNKYDIYYSIDSSFPEIDEGTKYKEPIELEQIVTDDLDDYPLTTSVDGILAHDKEGKCVSDIYNNNIQRTGKYPLFQKQNTITVRLVDKETKETVHNRSLTYLIDDKEYTIPVVSLNMPYDNWFGEEEGMYNKIREEVEHRVYLEYFDFKNDEYFSLNSKIKLGGNWTLGYPMRTLNLNFNKDENGNKNDPVNVPIFGDRVKRGDRDSRLKKLTRFRLHSGGNAFESWTGFNDAVIQSMMEDSNAPTTGFRPCIGYLNGEYWGLYYIREHYSDTYFKDNYGVDKDDVLFYELKGRFIVDDGDEEIGDAAIRDMERFLNGNDLAVYENYQTFINTYIDEDSFIDVFLAELFASNWDFVGNSNNLKMWRTSKIDPEEEYYDGKWRFCLHDVDFAFTDDRNFLDKNCANSYTTFKMFDSLLRQPEFRTKFYNRAVYLCKNNLSVDYASKVLGDMVSELMPYKLDAMKRWGKNDASYSEWLNEVDRTYQYFEDKNRTFLATLKDSLNQYE